VPRERVPGLKVVGVGSDNETSWRMGFWFVMNDVLWLFIIVTKEDGRRGGGRLMRFDEV